MFKQGRVDDFQAVVLPHLDAAYNLARWLVRDAALADDVVQDAFLRALKYFASFRGGSARAWLLQIVRNVAYAQFEAQQSRMEVSLATRTGAEDEEEESIEMSIPDPAPDPEATLLHQQERSLLEKGLNSLPVKLRECIVLRELEELSYKDIAQVTGVPIGTVMSRLARARQALQTGVDTMVSLPAAAIVVASAHTVATTS
jgi:RNA polymerase sigma factor (sigma-70 family)